jgi:hypothetical protein
MCVSVARCQQKFFYFLKICYIGIMFKSLPFTPRTLVATESRLQRIYDAAKMGLKGDALALAAGMLPVEYRQLCQLDPLADIAAQKGKADAEIEMSTQLHDAAMSGDSKAALAILQHVHGWTAKQEISVDVYQKISITQALEQAKERVLDGLITEQKPEYLENAKERTRSHVE